jgi:pSer/pThr/pTyr-binding forkhead associated (FHA) protein
LFIHSPPIQRANGAEADDFDNLAGGSRGCRDKKLGFIKSVSSANTEQLRSGTKLRHALYDSNGLLLLAAGAEVTPQLQRLLERRGIRLELYASLTVTEGTPQGLEIPLQHLQLLIGRAADCGIRPNSDIVSSHHCRLYKRSGGTYVVDLESTNGTFLNGQRITGETELHDNDMIRVGPMVFRVQVYYAMAATTKEDQTALDEWILAEPLASGPIVEPKSGPTVGVNIEQLLRRPGTSAASAGPTDAETTGVAIFPPES